jgi:hypothetical protein
MICGGPYYLPADYPVKQFAFRFFAKIRQRKSSGNELFPNRNFFALAVTVCFTWAQVPVSALRFDLAGVFTLGGYLPLPPPNVSIHWDFDPPAQCNAATQCNAADPPARSEVHPRYDGGAASGGAAHAPQCNAATQCKATVPPARSEVHPRYDGGAAGGGAAHAPFLGGDGRDGSEESVPQGLARSLVLHAQRGPRLR